MYPGLSTYSNSQPDLSKYNFGSSGAPISNQPLPGLSYGQGSPFGVTGDAYSVYNTDYGQPSQQGSQQPAPVDHTYDQWGGQSAYNTLKSGFDTQKQNIYGSANDAASALQGGYGQSIQDTLHNLTLGQQGIDRRNVQNEAARTQGGRGILDMIGRGIRSGGVMLANKNAGNSSAAGAIANAYGQLGQRQMSSVGNQYAQNQGDIGLAQQEQDYQQAQAPQKFHVDLMNNVNNIVNSARNQFAQLDAAMASASLPDRLAIEQEKENVRAQVLGQLQQYDAQLASGVGGIHATSQEQNRSTANQQLAAGQAPQGSFNYTTEAPLQFQGPSPAGGNLPLYSFNRNRQAA